MGLLYTFFADGEEKLLSTYITDPSEQYALQWDYSDFRVAEGQPFPMLMDVQVLANGSSQGEASLSVSPASRQMFRLIWTSPFRLSINVLPLHKS